MPSRQKRRRGKKHGNGSRPGQFAPLQGVDQKQWLQNELVPIRCRGGVAIPAQVPCIILVATDPNGYTYQILRQDTGVTLGSETQLWGQNNGQFLANAQLYEEFRVSHVETHCIPNQGGGLYSQGPLIYAIDPTGVFDQLSSGAVTPAELNQLLESMKTVNLTNPYKPCRRMFNYDRWIIQTQSTAWLKTQLTNVASPQREQYVTNVAGGNTNFRTPGTVFAWTVTANSAVTSAQLGIFEVRTKLIFRQRRLNPQLDPSVDKEVGTLIA